jgi:predicted ATP-grasp superfamily ATP-dependent carboligase
MSQQRADKPTILITDAGRGSAIAFIRSLGRRGWRIIAADSDPHSLGFRSRYAPEHVVYPAPETAPRELAATLLQTARDKRVDLLIPVTDDVILPLTEAAAEFAGVCKLAMPDRDRLDVVTNKLKTLELAKQLGVPVPRTRLITTVQGARDVGSALGWPVVLKPQASRLYLDHRAVDMFEVGYAENLDGLLKQMARFEGRCPVLLQEYYPGVGHGVELLLYEGKALAAFQHKRLHEVPFTGGASSFRESVPLDPTMYGYSERLLEALKWTGLAMVEFKVGSEGAKLMEINGRIWGSLPLAVLSGVDFPGRMAELYLYGPPASAAVATDYRVGVRARNLERDIVWVMSVLLGRRRFPFLPAPERWRAVSALLGFLNPVTKSDILSLDDPRPGLAEIPMIISKLSRKRKQLKQAEG